MVSILRNFFDKAPADFQKAHEILSKYSAPVKSMPLGPFSRDCSDLSKGIDSNRRAVVQDGITVELNGTATRIDDSLAKAVAPSVKEMSPLFVKPISKVSVEWQPGLTLPGFVSRREKIYSGILNYGAEAAQIAVWYGLSRDLAREMQNGTIKWSPENDHYNINLSPKDQLLWKTIAENYLPLEWSESALKAFDFTALMSTQVKDWGLAHRMETMRNAGHTKVRVEIFDLFASVAVMVRFFPAELKKRIEGITDPTQREAARTFAQTVAQKFGIK